jgi:hypothetical protein
VNVQAGRADGIDLLPEYKKFAEDNLNRLKEETGLDLHNVHFEVRNCFLPDLEVRDDSPLFPVQYKRERERC